ncbi:dipeptide epimerase [Halococcus sediminicola]|uniref:dipeptide epimerase n=1 Tax=Halococcus sediminicola TaxID=1264579 RepID=UPI00067842E4|nr:dipeptide epimerase [Halococcus sediminicola]
MITIEEITVEPLDLPLEEPFEIALGTQHKASNILVKVRTESGTTGIGEASPLPPVTGETQDAAVETVRAATDLLNGADLTDYRNLIEELHQTFPGMVSATFALETALLDAYCRELDLPLAALFGGSPKPISTDLTIPIVEPNAARERAREAVNQGYTEIKVKTGTTIERDLNRIEAVADVASTCELKVDGNQGWSPAQTCQFAREVADTGIDISLIEQPVSKTDLKGLNYIRAKISIPIAADETVFSPADALRVINEDAADIINIKLGKSGLLRAADIASIAQAAGRELMIGCMLESAIGIHTSAHFVSGRGGFSYIDLDGNKLIANDIIETNNTPEIAPSGPGHGVNPQL